ncbi:MAG: DUF3341 domain-containing protein [Verrucomicrobiae bacterium]|nr:DUF3341 domain-containing protein [Verrucomicrobiae bacterium]
MNQSHDLFGMLAEFGDPHDLLEATQRAFAQGYRRMDAYSPFPIEGLAEALGYKKTGVAIWVLLGGLLGAVGGYFLQYYSMAVDYTFNIGNRPLNSWPMFIPISFELMVLSAAFCAVIAMLSLNRLPQPFHPLFYVPEFARVSTDRFFLCIQSADSQFDTEQTRDFLMRLNPICVTEVPQ